MKNKWKPRVDNKGDICAKVVNTAALSISGIANGRTIPVVILQSDPDQKIDTAINGHIGIPTGNCLSQWGRTWNGEKILLHLELSSPVAISILIPFDIIGNGPTIDQIIHTQCLYLMTGAPGTKLSENLDKARILLEIPSREFASEWQKMYKKRYCKHLRKTYHISRKASESVFEKIQEEFSSVKNLRVK